ncbi:YfdX family protein [Methylobacter tundripaludum]|uniref:YfdX family protein n=1 Tax=Methylobacter tundripaludum TaxID=173365 RepID=UPI0004DF694C|nr:YfdX family protein [Methylobacter tundripaludum]
MKTHIHKLATYTALVLVSTLPFSVDVLADVEKKPSSVTSSSSTDKNSSAFKRKVLTEKNQQIVSEARDSVSGTQQALMNLEKNDPKAALAILQDVSKKLSIILAKNPDLALVSADIEADIFDFEGDAKAIKKELKQADDLLDSGKLQSARQVLAELASEMRITTISIPLNTFPLAIKNAVTLIDAGKTSEAASVLDEVLNTLVERTEIIPLPILRAEALLTEASIVEHKEDMSKEKSRAEVLKFADAAKEKLKIAELLGYGGKDDYKLLYTAIDEIKETMHSEKSAATWEKVKQTLTDLRNKIIQPKK